MFSGEQRPRVRIFLIAMFITSNNKELNRPFQTFQPSKTLEDIGILRIPDYIQILNTTTNIYVKITFRMADQKHIILIVAMLASISKQFPATFCSIIRFITIICRAEILVKLIQYNHSVSLRHLPKAQNLLFFNHLMKFAPVRIFLIELSCFSEAAKFLKQEDSTQSKGIFRRTAKQPLTDNIRM